MNFPVNPVWVLISSGSTILIKVFAVDDGVAVNGPLLTRRFLCELGGCTYDVGTIYDLTVLVFLVEEVTWYKGEDLKFLFPKVVSLQVLAGSLKLPALPTI